MRLFCWILLGLVLWAHPVHADDLDQAIRNAMRSYVATYPDYPDLPVGWIQTNIRGLESNADLTQVVTPLTIKAFVISGVPTDHPNWAERAGTFANALHQWCGVLPQQTLTAAELLKRLKEAYDELYPVPTYKPTHLPPGAYTAGEPPMRTLADAETSE